MDKKDDYLVLFQGAKISKREANKVGVGILFGIIGILGTHYIQIGQAKIINYIVIFIFSLVGYLWVGNKLFKNKSTGDS